MTPRAGTGDPSAAAAPAPVVELRARPHGRELHVQVARAAERDGVAIVQLRTARGDRVGVVDLHRPATATGLRAALAVRVPREVRRPPLDEPPPGDPRRGGEAVGLHRLPPEYRAL